VAGSTVGPAGRSYSGTYMLVQVQVGRTLPVQVGLLGTKYLSEADCRSIADYFFTSPRAGGLTTSQ